MGGDVGVSVGRPIVEGFKRGGAGGCRSGGGPSLLMGGCRSSGQFLYGVGKIDSHPPKFGGRHDNFSDGYTSGGGLVITIIRKDLFVGSMTGGEALLSRWSLQKKILENEVYGRSSNRLLFGLEKKTILEDDESKGKWVNCE